MRWYMRKRIRVLISGEVQGVWFRANTRDRAIELGLNGWVRNTSDGKVEAVFEGEEERIKRMIEWCRHGPPLARVEKLEIRWEEPKNERNGFSIRYS
jgi:acylphosphatase